ncbi:MAG: hypothetical protein ACE5IL_14410 [Myxococcota bacterium]
MTKINAATLPRSLPRTESWARLGGGAIAVLAALAFSQPAVAGSDLWWHLASGRHIFEVGWVPSSDGFSYTEAGTLWMNHEWLWDVVYWTAYRFDPQACAWLNLGVVAAIFATLYSVALRESGSVLAAGLAVVAAAAASHWFIDLRPHLFTLLLVAAFLRTRHWRHAPWLWPPAVVVWTNLHAGFTFGIGMIGLWVGLETLRKSLEARRLVLEPGPWISVGLCLGAVLVNPWGYRILAYPLDYLDASSPFRSIIEWMPPPWSLDPSRYDGRFWWLVALWLASAVPAFRRRALYPLALSVVALAMAWTSRRFIPLFAITGAPVMALGLAAYLEALRARWPSLRHPRAAIATVLVAIAVTGLLWRDVRLRPDLLYRWTQQSFYPAAATAYLNALEPPRRLFNLYNWGGYLMLHAPQVKVFIDGRANTLYDDELYRNYGKIAGGGPDTERLIRRYRFDMALVPRSSPLVTRLGRLAHPWRVIYADASTIILVPSGSPYLTHPRPSIEKVVGDRPAWLLARARSEEEIGDFARARELLERAVAIQPLYVSGYNELMGLAALEKDRARISAVLARGLEAIPREAPRLYQFAGYSYQFTGQPARALAALRKGLPTGPFNSAAGLRRQIAKLEASLARSAGAPPGADGEGG